MTFVIGSTGMGRRALVCAAAVAWIAAPMAHAQGYSHAGSTPAAGNGSGTAGGNGGTAGGNPGVGGNGTAGARGGDGNAGARAGTHVTSSSGYYAPPEDTTGGRSTDGAMRAGGEGEGDTGNAGAQGAQGSQGSQGY